MKITFTFDKLIDYGRKITGTPPEAMPPYFHIYNILAIRHSDTEYHLLQSSLSPYVRLCSDDSLTLTGLDLVPDPTVCAFGEVEL